MTNDEMVKEDDMKHFVLVHQIPSLIKDNMGDYGVIIGHHSYEDAINSVRDILAKDDRLTHRNISLIKGEMLDLDETLLTTVNKGVIMSSTIKWRSAEDELPKSDADVLVKLANGDITIAWVDSYLEFNPVSVEPRLDDCEVVFSSQVLEWMYLKDVLPGELL